MTKKNQEKKNIQKTGQESDEVKETLFEADQADPKSDAADAGLDEQGVATDDPNDEKPGDDVAEAAGNDDPNPLKDESMDDILADVRHSLIEEDSTKTEKKPKWWNRLVKGTSNQETPNESPPGAAEVDSPVAVTPANVESDGRETGEYAEQIDDLIKLLETDEIEDVENEPGIPAQVPPPVEPEIRANVDELKKQAFSPRSMDEKPEDFSEVRKVTLGGEEDVFVEVEAKTENTLDDRIRSVENALRPYRRYIYYVIAFIGAIMAVMALTLMYNAYQKSLPEPDVTEVSTLPYPITISLPGGLNFNLGKGTLKDGDWNPRGPEWLEGTEVCRWVAIPWSRQLEAAIRTLNRDDVLELLMSNNDRLSYQVESIRELTPAELQKMDSNLPCLAVILAEQDSEKRWVVVGRP